MLKLDIQKNVHIYCGTSIFNLQVWNRNSFHITIGTSRRSRCENCSKGFRFLADIANFMHSLVFMVSEGSKQPHNSVQAISILRFNDCKST